MNEEAWRVIPSTYLNDNEKNLFVRRQSILSSEKGGIKAELTKILNERDQEHTKDKPVERKISTLPPSKGPTPRSTYYTYNKFQQQDMASKQGKTWCHFEKDLQKPKLSAAMKQRLYRERKQDKYEKDKTELYELRAWNSKLEMENQRLWRQQEQLKRELDEARANTGLQWHLYENSLPAGMQPRQPIATKTTIPSTDMPSLHSSAGLSFPAEPGATPTTFQQAQIKPSYLQVGAVAQKISQEQVQVQQPEKYTDTGDCDQVYSSGSSPHRTKRIKRQLHVGPPSSSTASSQGESLDINRGGLTVQQPYLQPPIVKSASLGLWQRSQGIQQPVKMDPCIVTSKSASRSGLAAPSITQQQEQHPEINQPIMQQKPHTGSHGRICKDELSSNRMSNSLNEASGLASADPWSQPLGFFPEISHTNLMREKQGISAGSGVDAHISQSLYMTNMSDNIVQAQPQKSTTLSYDRWWPALGGPFPLHDRGIGTVRGLSKQQENWMSKGRHEVDLQRNKQQHLWRPHAH